MTEQQTPTRAKWRQSDVTKACKGVSAAGHAVSRVRVDPFTGEIFVFIGEPASDGAAPNVNEWD
jgi:hypothetical protein